MIRRAQLSSLAKINLDLRVLHKRADGFHELRTVFQTISLADSIEIAFEPARQTTITLKDDPGIPDNLVLRAADACMAAMKVRGRVTLRLKKQIPMGAGLGGGSSNAAAVLLALPVLAGRSLELEQLSEIGAELGSDVPFFLMGGTALGIGRGTELYPLPDIAPNPLLLVTSGIHMSTPEAYRALNRPVETGRGPMLMADTEIRPTLTGDTQIRPTHPADKEIRATGQGLTEPGSSSNINNFRQYVRVLGEVRSAWAARQYSRNDFEAAVFGRHPQLQRIVQELDRAGARVAGRSRKNNEVAPNSRMTGSGSTLFRLFEDRDSLKRVLRQWERSTAGSLSRAKLGMELQWIPAKLVTRRAYRAMWRRSLNEHSADTGQENQWPLPSKYGSRAGNR